MTTRRLLRAALLCAWSASIPAALAASDPTPTPTPRARLTGGFGRAPAVAPASAPSTEGEARPSGDSIRAARRRKEQKAVAITNDSLVRDPKKGHVSTSQMQPSPPPSAAARKGAGTPASLVPTPASAPAAGEEALWRERAQSARRRVEDGKAQIARLEAESKQLETDFYRWDDGQYRDRVIKPAWDKKREELETAKRSQTQAETDLADLPEKARRAGVPPGWLRE